MIKEKRKYIHLFEGDAHEPNVYLKFFALAQK